jgi:lysozyme family protein
MDFERAVNFVLEHEGGYVNDINDPGGETKYGISKRSYPDLDIRNLTIGHATHIYEKDFWVPMKCPALSDIMRLPVFDMAVNQGKRAASMCLQRSCNIKDDGIFGVQTLANVQAFDQDDLYSNFTMNRIDSYFKTKNFNLYGRGWIRRVCALTIYNSKGRESWRASYLN